MIKVLVPIANGSEEVEAVTPIDIMRRAGFDVTVAGESHEVTCSRGVKILPDKPLGAISSAEAFDAVVIPGGAEGTKRLMQNAALRSVTERLAGSGKLVAAICAAPTILAAWHLLPKNAEVTYHPGARAAMEGWHCSDKPVVVSGHFITSRGAGTSIEFALAVVKYLAGEEKAREVAGSIVFHR